MEINRLRNEIEIFTKENEILKKSLNNLKLKISNQELFFKEKNQLEAKCINLEQKLENLTTGVVSVDHVKLLENENENLKNQIFFLKEKMKI